MRGVILALLLTLAGQQHAVAQPAPSPPSGIHVACLEYHSFPTSALQKSNNPDFQQKSWKTGCHYADHSSTTLQECKDMCRLGSGGCCAQGAPFTCRSNSCGGGGAARGSGLEGYHRA